jgi:hypothetical protein
MTSQPYNYATFPSGDDVHYFSAFAEHLKVGETAPDPELLDLARGEMLHLSEVTKSSALTVIELGSLT